MNKKGFTVVELIVSFALTVIVVGMLFQMLLSLKEVYIASGFKSQMLNKQTLISSKINQDLNNKTLKIALKCGDNCLNFIYEDGTNKKLIIDDKNNIFTYGDYSTKLVNGSVFGDFYIKNEKIVGLDSTSNYDSIIEIKVPISHSLLKDDYGINMIYQYNSNTSSIADIIFDSTNKAEDKIILKGSKMIYQSDAITFTDPGYYVYKSDGTVEDNSASVTKTGTVGNTIGNTYKIIYTLKDVNNEVIDIVTREVTIVKGLYNFDYTGNYETFTAPASGAYQFEAWGAQGGGTPGGKGAYTTGTVLLEKNDVIYVYVGQYLNAANGTSFNGGTGSSGGAPGGGATDYRLSSGNWNDTTGLRNRIMVASGGGAGIVAGKSDGGTLVGFNGNTTAGGGTQTSGGSGSDGFTAGTFGIGGNGCGGGGGYYAGGGAACANGAGGGSSFISGYQGVNAINSSGVHINSNIHPSGISFFNTQMIAGNASMPNPRAAGNITGNTGNGYAKITLISTVTESFVSISSVEYLIVAGGGAGGNYVAGGGGGAGGVLTGSVSVEQKNYNVVVGLGGTGKNGAGNKGENSSFNGITSIGGGGGGSGWSFTKGTTGGSAGGTSGGDGANSMVSLIGELGTSGQGNNSGTAWRCSNNSGVGAGGGGAGGAGTSGICTTRTPGNGGIGISSSISGSAVWYAGGGAGDSYNPNIAGTGGAGGGGNAGSAGVPNTGGGGGSGYGLSNNGFPGGSGIVIVRYLGTQKASGGTVTYVGGYTIHTFNSSGTFIVW